MVSLVGHIKEFCLYPKAMGSQDINDRWVG